MLDRDQLEQLHVQPKSRRELKETLDRFEAKWHRKAEISAKRQGWSVQ